MQFSIQGRRDSSTLLAPNGAWKIGSISAGVAAIILSTAMFMFQRVEIGQVLLAFALATFCFVAAVHARFLYLARQQYRSASGNLQTKEREFQAIFENALDAILILDSQGICLDANPSALDLLAVRREQLVGQPIIGFYADRRVFDSSWEKLLSQQRGRGQAEIVRTDGVHAFVEFTARAHFLPDRHMMVLRDVTQRRRAEETKAQSLALAKSAWREADALRKATLALTQDLRMNSVLDTLLQTLHQFVVYEAAQVLLLETETKLFLAREVVWQNGTGPFRGCPDTLNTFEHPVIKRVLESREGTLISDTAEEPGWTFADEQTPMRSWLAVPLLSSNQVLGLLLLSHAKPESFTAEHLRVSGSLGVAAAIAIQNARLYERAEIYGAELERRLSDLRQAQQALEQLKTQRSASES